MKTANSSTASASPGLGARLVPHLPAAVPGLALISVMLVWAAHNGGYDADTWYWGTLVVLGVLAPITVGSGRRRRISRSSLIALGLFSLYVAWSYLSVTWAQSPGAALQGSNRALLYLLVFAAFTTLPWTLEAALGVLLTYALGVGTIALTLLVRFAVEHQSMQLFINGRLSAPTGYFNSTAALFTTGAIVAIVLAARRGFPAPLRGLLLALAAADLEGALTCQSRGWLFTLPILIIVALGVLPGRLRVAIAAAIPAAATALPVHQLLHVYELHNQPGFASAIRSAGRLSVFSCALVFVVGTTIAWVDGRVSLPTLTEARQRILDLGVIVIVIAVIGGAGVVATRGHPVRFATREWRGFSQPDIATTRSHYTDVGSGRADIWRVGIDAVIAHPLGGLGQDNFADYYTRHKRIAGAPQWTHSLEVRLLAHTGIAGFTLFAGFLLAALAACAGPRWRATPLARYTVGAALLPSVVWLLQGSIDWFWEMPALTGPALGFLGMAGALRSGTATTVRAGGEAVRPRLRLSKPLAIIAMTLAFAGALLALVPAYLSVREVSLATDARQAHPATALRDLSRAASYNPLNAEPGQIAGIIALQIRQYAVADRRFTEATTRDPQNWFSWMGRGFAETALGHRAGAARAFVLAQALNPTAPLPRAALQSIRRHRPIGPAAGLRMLLTTA